MKATLLQRLGRVSCAAAPLLAFACTNEPSPASPGQSQTPSAQGSNLLALGPAREVIDPLGRWRSELAVASEVELLDEPGFIQLQVQTPKGVALSCFVYEMSLDTGQAVLRFLRAVSAGLRFRSFELLGVEAKNGAPVLHFSGAYDPERPGGRGGELSMMLSPRIQFPVMCTHDGPVADPSFPEIAAGFLEAFRVSQKVERQLLLSEIWALESEQTPLGFSWFQSYEGAEQVVSNLSLSSTFVWSEQGAKTTDSAAVEIEDAEGVSQGRWLISRNTEKLVELSLKRHSSSESGAVYRFLGELEGRAVAGDFEVSATLRSSRFLDQILGRPREAGTVVDQSWLQYMPEFNSAGPTSIRLSQSEPGQLLLERGPSRTVLLLGADERPRQRSLGASDKDKAAPPVEARLLLRGP